MKLPSLLHSRSRFPLFFLLPFLLSVFLSSSVSQVFAQEQKTYIAVLKKNTFPLDGTLNGGSLSKDQEDGSEWIALHDSILASIVTKESETSPRKLYSHFSAINAFSALLSDGQAAQLAKHSEVDHILVDGVAKKHTTYSHSFLGLDTTPNSVWSKTNGTNTIIGVLDDGIWPESSSFAPGKLGPVPKKFKGVCQTGQNFTKKHCNRKIVGARYFARGFLAGQTPPLSRFPSGYSDDYVSPRSAYGHGVHVSAIAGGNVVSNVQLGGIRFGTAKGVSFSSRIAVYKVCWGNDVTGGCFISDLVAGIDQAVRDGVDVISMSIGSSSTQIIQDRLGQALLGAMLAGIPCVLSAGNDGPQAATVSNGYPWALTVASSTLDRLFSNSIQLGNGKSFPGVGITLGTKKSYPLVSGYDELYSQSEFCFALNPKKVKNKIVYCRGLIPDTVYLQSNAVYSAGGIGMIVSNIKYTSKIEWPPEIGLFSVPSSQINSIDARVVEDYIQNSKSPTARITPFKTLHGSKYKEAPFMSSTSSNGPNPLTGLILKPDLTAPGESILSAWAPDKRSPVLPFDKTAKFAFSSGTSMACPHVSGAIALLKSLHPKWPVSWLYSALITTAYTKTNRNNSIQQMDGQIASPLNYGSGHINVPKALFPGLVYAWTTQDLTFFKCLTSKQENQCGSETGLYEVNFPTLSLPSLCKTTTVKRRLTSVSSTRSSYSVTVSSPKGTVVTVSPKKLLFTKFGQTLAYQITVKPITAYDDLNLNYASFKFTYGSVTWKDKSNNVKLTLAVNVPSYCN